MDTQLSVHRSVSSRLYGDSDRLSFHPDLHDSCTQLPSEVLEIIITEFWHSENTLFISRSILEGCIRLCHFSRHLLSNSSLSSVSPLHCSLQTFSNLLPFSPRIYPYHDLLCRSHGISQGRRHLHPYPILGSMPNYIEFRIDSGLYSHRGQITRTRVSIGLDKAAAAPSVLPVDWCMAVNDAPHIDQEDDNSVCNTWESLYGYHA
ncbi:hypothetical protein EDD18DRAFT_117631 [Armillaria luteobubalina]|uniref:Uncharacterized protein n=1 Tax=Armillaria luteobubalina TaxID=153913 RepID=A0AA39UUD6_9AGAR|nr:hypothetical protein EDD18DRAFT_117631 [Armillaria luteobubalina]